MWRQDIRGGVIHMVQEKTGKASAIPIHPALDRALRAGPARGMNLISDKHGRPTKGKGLSEFMVRAAAIAALPRERTAHG